MAKVIRKIRNGPGAKLTIKQFKELHRLIDEIFDEADARGYTWQDLATRAGLGYNTVYNLAKYVTMYPQIQTVFLLAKAVGFTARWHKIKEFARAAA